MGRLILGLLLGVALIFPGIELLRWLATKVLGVYPDMTLTDACLAMIVILQAVILVRGNRRTPSAHYPPKLGLAGSDIDPPRPRRPRPRRDTSNRSRDVDEGAPLEGRFSRRTTGRPSDRRRR